MESACFCQSHDVIAGTWLLSVSNAAAAPSQSSVQNCSAASSDVVLDDQSINRHTNPEPAIDNELNSVTNRPKRTKRRHLTNSIATNNTKTRPLSTFDTISYIIQLTDTHIHR